MSLNGISLTSLICRYAHPATYEHPILVRPIRLARLILLHCHDIIARTAISNLRGGR